MILPASNDEDSNVTEDNVDNVTEDDNVAEDDNVIESDDNAVSDSEQNASFVDTPTDNSPKDPSDDGYVDLPTEE